MANQWFRLYHDFLDDEKIISMAFEDQRHFVGILILKSSGIIDKTIDIEILNRIVAQRLWIDFAIVKDVKKRLIDVGLINEFWQPLAWDKRQFKSDFDTTNAERQARFREKNKEKQQHSNNNALCNAKDDCYITPLDTENRYIKQKTDKQKTDKNTNVFLEKAIVLSAVAESTRVSEKNEIHEKIVNLYHATLPERPKVLKLTEIRKKRMDALLKKDIATLDEWKSFFVMVSQSDFLMGRTPNWTGCDFEWLINPANALKVAEGRYRNNAKKKRGEISNEEWNSTDF